MESGLPNRGAVANTLMGLIGLGVLNLPWATKQVGWLPSVIGMALVCAITVYGIFLAVRAREKLDRLREGDEDVDGDGKEIKGQTRAGSRAPSERTPLMASPASRSSSSPILHRGCGLGCFDPVVYEVLGWPGLAVWASSILLCQAGTAIAYITVIMKSAETLGMKYVHAFCFLGVLLMALCAARHVRGVACLSCAGLFVYVFMFGGLLYESCLLGVEGKLGASAHMISSTTTEYDFMAWFGIASFAFGALPISMSVYDSMAKPEQFYRVTSISYALCWAMYSVVAVLGYLSYGEKVEAIIFFNFAQGTLFRVGSMVLFSMVLVVAYVVQMIPVFNFAQLFLGDHVHWLLTRVAIVGATMVTAHCIPSTVVLVTVLGSFAAALSCFVMPPLVYVNVSPPPSPFEFIMCCGLIGLGVLVVVEALLG